MEDLGSVYHMMFLLHSHLVHCFLACLDNSDLALVTAFKKIICGCLLRLEGACLPASTTHLDHHWPGSTCKSLPALLWPSCGCTFWLSICMSACLLASSLHPTSPLLPFPFLSFLPIFSVLSLLLFLPTLSREGLLLIHLYYMGQVLFGILATKFPILWSVELRLSPVHKSPNQRFSFDAHQTEWPTFPGSCVPLDVCLWALQCFWFKKQTNNFPAELSLTFQKSEQVFPNVYLRKPNHKHCVITSSLWHILQCWGFTLILPVSVSIFNLNA